MSTSAFIVGKTPPLPGVYEIVDGSHVAPRDAELPPGQLEIYDHPIRGRSFWDDSVDDGTDFSGHVAWHFLEGLTLRPVAPSNESRAATED